MNNRVYIYWSPCNELVVQFGFQICRLCTLLHQHAPNNCQRTKLQQLDCIKFPQYFIFSHTAHQRTPFMFVCAKLHPVECWLKYALVSVFFLLKKVTVEGHSAFYIWPYLISNCSPTLGKHWQLLCVQASAPNCTNPAHRPPPNQRTNLHQGRTQNHLYSLFTYFQQQQIIPTPIHLMSLPLPKPMPEAEMDYIVSALTPNKRISKVSRP